MAAQEFTRCVARAVNPLMAARGTPEPWQDSGLESLYAGLPFWVNASANYNSTARSDTAQARPRPGPRAALRFALPRASSDTACHCPCP